MAFLRKAGNVFGRTLSSHINQEITSSRPSIFQAIRCMTTSKLFIGGLSYGTDDMSLSEAFSKYGEVVEARVIVDRDTGKSRGFGFVTYDSVDGASAAIQALDQQELQGRRIRVDYANDRVRGGGGGGYQGGGYGGGGYGGGYNNNDGYGGNYGGGGGNYGRAGGGYGGGQNFGVAGGGAGGSSNAGGSHFASSGQEGFGDTIVGAEHSNQFGHGDEGFGHDEPSEGNYGDDDDAPGNYGNRRA
ncbi:glycine-rich RNA-binding protein 2, mitochondrial-like [Henckelia pumila]|uniref:glycine-rich RNA-binding protein 2, mitochondrial-like n=1 Tax=Henckelia pumila TaxID=405737 RepID=UPI003C6DFC36